MKEKLPIYMIGSGGHASVVLDILLLNGLTIEGVIQNTNLINKKFKSFELFSENNFMKYFGIEDVRLVNGIGNMPKNNIRMNVTNNFKSKKYKFISTIHPSATIEKNIELPSDIQVMAGVVINSGCQIGNDCIINTRAVLDHDCQIGNNTHIAPGAVLCGGVKVGRDSFIGANSTILQGVSIKAGTLVAAASLVQVNNK